MAGNSQSITYAMKEEELPYARTSAIIVELEAARSSDTSPAGPAAEFSKTHVLDQDAAKRLVKANRGGGWALRFFMLVVVPLLLFGLLTGLGIMAVNLAADAAEDNNKDLAFHSARDMAGQFEFQLEQSQFPVNNFQLLVEQQPSWSFWRDNFDRIAEEVLSKGINGSIWNIQMQPFGQIALIYPLRPADMSQIGRDLLADPTRRNQIYPIIQSHEISTSVAFAAQGFLAAFIRTPVFILGTELNETFGYNFAGSNYSSGSSNVSFSSSEPPFPPVPFPMGPPATGYPYGYQNMCSICYNASNFTSVPPIPSSRFWGSITVMLNFDAVSKGTDSRLHRLTSDGYNYLLVRPLNNTSYTIAQQGSVDLATAVPVSVSVPGEEWILYVELASGSWYPSWQKPLIGAVVAISFVISLLAFLAIWFYFKQRDQLSTTKSVLEEMKVVNKALEESTKSQLHVSWRLAQEVKKSDKLLYRMLPPHAAEKLRKGLSVEAEDYPSVSILFTDIMGFTEISARCTPREVYQMLDQLYLTFDSILNEYPELFKVETIGDAYMVVANLSRKCSDHADQMIVFGLRLQEATTNMIAPDGTPLRIRLGINSGHVVGGVIGSEMPHFCLFGNTVNTASRMESHGLPCRVHISQATLDAIVDRSRFIVEDRGMVDIKGRGLMHTYLVTGVHRSNLDSQTKSIRLPDNMRFSQLIQANWSASRRLGRHRSNVGHEAKDLEQVLENDAAEFFPEDALDTDDFNATSGTEKEVMMLGMSSFKGSSSRGDGEKETAAAAAVKQNGHSNVI